MTDPEISPLPATSWDLTVTWLTRAVVALFAAAVALALASLWPATWTCAGIAFGLTCAVTVMAHLSCQCGGRLSATRVTREGEQVRLCADCAAGRGPGTGECCPHGIPWSGWPCRECEYPAVFGEVPGSGPLTSTEG